jgi:hypothetical protein
MGASGWSPRGVASHPGEGGDRSIGKEPQDGVGSQAWEKEDKWASVSGSLLARDLTTPLRASQSSWGMTESGGEVPWEAAWASSMTETALAMIAGSRSRTTVERLSECSCDMDGEGTALRMASNSSSGMSSDLPAIMSHNSSAWLDCQRAMGCESGWTLRKASLSALRIPNTVSKLGGCTSPDGGSIDSLVLR